MGEPGSADAQRLERAEHERATLSCPTCGAGNRLAADVLDHGFQRCAHCEAAMPVEGAGAYAVRDAVGGHTRVITPGRIHFVMLLGRVVPAPVLLLVLLGVGVVVTMIEGSLRRDGRDAAALALSVGFVLVLAVAFVLLVLEQHLLVTENRVESWWRLWRLRPCRRRVATPGLRLEVRQKFPPALLLWPPGGRPLRIGTMDAIEAERLEPKVAAAIAEARRPIAAETVRCPGCGGPITSPRRLREEGGMDCPHCASGVVAVEGGVVLGRCRLVHGLDDSEAARAKRRRPVRRRTQRGVEWVLHSELALRPLPALGNWFALFGLGLAFVGLGALIIWRVEEERVLGILLGGLIALVGAGLCLAGTTWQMGRHRFRLDETVLEHELFLGPLRLRRSIVPLPRLLSLVVSSSPASVDLKMTTATDEAEASLPHRLGESEALAIDLVAEMRERLVALGRKVSVGGGAPGARAARS